MNIEYNIQNNSPNILTPSPGLWPFFERILLIQLKKKKID